MINTLKRRTPCSGFSHSPLEGESRKPNRQVKADSVGGAFSVACPPTNSPAGFALASLTPPQGGSEIQYAPFVGFFNNSLKWEAITLFPKDHTINTKTEIHFANAL